MEDVERVVRSSGVRLVQNSGPQLRGGDGAARIAQHYKFALSGAFDQYKDAPAVIIGKIADRSKDSCHPYTPP